MADDAAIKTYRYLRIGMVGVVGLLASSVGFERAQVSCWQTSISAYYYTPMRAIFVGGLMAVGLCLIVIKGSTAWEDACLNVAGMFAPLVAVVPTSDVGRCWSVPPGPSPVGPDGSLAPWVVATIDNNVKALLVAGFAGLIVAAVIASVATRDVLAVMRVGRPGMRYGLLGALVILIVGAVAFGVWGDFHTRAHSLAAIVMFGFLAAAVAGNAWERRGSATGRAYFLLYGVISVSMVVAAVVLLAVRSRFEHTVLLLESIEIALFAAFWLVQTHEHWYETA